MRVIITQVFPFFDFKVPKTKIAKDFIENALIKSDIDHNHLVLKPNTKVVWVGGTPNVEHSTKSIYNDCILVRPYIGDCNYKHIRLIL